MPCPIIGEDIKFKPSVWFRAFLCANPRDEVALADKIIALLENQELKRNMAQNSYQLCCKKFDVKKINEILLKKMHLL